MDTPHNRRVQAQREGAVVKFCESTGADTHTANALLQQHAYDLDRAVGARGRRVVPRGTRRYPGVRSGCFWAHTTSIEHIPEKQPEESVTSDALRPL